MSANHMDLPSWIICVTKYGTYIVKNLGLPKFVYLEVSWDKYYMVCDIRSDSYLTSNNNIDPFPYRTLGKYDG